MALTSVSIGSINQTRLEVLGRPILEDLKENYVDWHIHLVQVSHDSLCTGIENGRNYDDLVGTVQLLLLKSIWN